eukprot:g17922.t1
MSSKTDRALLQLLFELLGWRISPEKSEDQFQNVQRLITVLGVSYAWRDLNVTEVTIEDRTAQECLNPIVHGYTDAAVDDAREANIAIEWARASGRTVDLTPFNVRIGGFLNLAPAEEMAFSCTLTTVPEW